MPNDTDNHHGFTSNLDSGALNGQFAEEIARLFGEQLRQLAHVLSQAGEINGVTAKEAVKEAIAETVAVREEVRTRRIVN